MRPRERMTPGRSHRPPGTRRGQPADSPRADLGKGRGGWRADFPVSHNGGATRLRTPEEPEVESSKHQDDTDIHRKSLPEPGSASEKTQVYTDYDGDHRHHEKGGNDLSAHAGGKCHLSSPSPDPPPQLRGHGANLPRGRAPARQRASGDRHGWQPQFRMGPTKQRTADRARRLRRRGAVALDAAVEISAVAPGLRRVARAL